MPKPVCEFCKKEFKDAFYSESYGRWAHGDCSCEETLNKKVDEYKKFKYQKMIENRKYLLKDFGISQRYLDKRFDDFIADTEAKKRAIHISKMFVERPKEKGIIFSGNVGTGKTLLCSIVANEILEKHYLGFHVPDAEIDFELRHLIDYKSFDITMLTVINFLDLIKETYQERSSKTEEEIIRHFIRVPILIFDDFGKEYIKQNDKGASWSDEKIYKVINGRYERELPVIITTNLSMSDLEKKVDKAIVSRLFEMCIGVKCDWEDHRKKIK